MKRETTDGRRRGGQDAEKKSGAGAGAVKNGILIEVGCGGEDFERAGESEGVGGGYIPPPVRVGADKIEVEGVAGREKEFVYWMGENKPRGY